MGHLQVDVKRNGTVLIVAKRSAVMPHVVVAVKEKSKWSPQRHANKCLTDGNLVVRMIICEVLGIIIGVAGIRNMGLSLVMI